jgi:2-polyprenyl-6-hydroxyphenyl methylase/3-demethylubiquinone-9 3-methyltransferase
VNVDPRETEKFGRLSAEWWDPGGAMHSLHDMNPLRTRFIAQNAELPGRRVLDVGCGGGILSEALARLGARVTGIDLSRPLIEVAQAHARQHGLDIDYRCMSVEQLAAEAPSTFDIVVCMEMLEHVPGPAAIVSACSQLIRPGGHAFFSTVNRNLKTLLFVIVGGEYIVRLLPRGSHTYGKLIRPSELRAWARGHGLSFVNSTTIAYNPFTRKFSLAPGEDMSYTLHFKQGLSR